MNRIFVLFESIHHQSALWPQTAATDSLVQPCRSCWCRCEAVHQRIALQVALVLLGVPKLKENNLLVLAVNEIVSVPCPGISSERVR